MAATLIDKKAAINYGWERVKSDLAYWLILMVLAAIVFVVPSYIIDNFKEVNSGILVITSLAVWVLQIGVGLGLIGITLKVYDGEHPPILELFNYFHFFWRYFLASLLYGLVIMVGLFLLVVPAFIWAVKYSLFAYYIVDRGARPLEALQLSADATRGVKGQLFLFLGLLFLINLLGVLMLGLGLLITVPISYLAWAKIYRQLSASVPVPTAAEKPARVT